MGATETDCRTEEGITVGLIDSAITVARVLASAISRRRLSWKLYAICARTATWPRFCGRNRVRLGSGASPIGVPLLPTYHGLEHVRADLGEPEILPGGSDPQNTARRLLPGLRRVGAEGREETLIAMRKFFE